MNNLLIVKNTLEIAVAIILTLGILFSLAGSVRDKVNRVALHSVLERIRYMMLTITILFCLAILLSIA